MAQFNYNTREIIAKVVYYGPSVGGKTTNLQWLHSKLDPRSVGKLFSLETEADRTLFFDLLPINLGNIKGMDLRLKVYTVPGQVKYNSTRKMVLTGADAVTFVADRIARMPRSQSPPAWAAMNDALGWRAASAAKSAAVDSPGRFPVILYQVC